MERIITCIPPNPRRVGYIDPIHGPLDGPLYMGSHIHQQICQLCVKKQHISCVLVCVLDGFSPFPCIVINSLVESHTATCVIREKIEAPFQPSKCCSAMRSVESKGV